MRKFVFCSTVCLVLVINAGAQESIVTDRPDLTESGSTVGMGVFQLESGTLFERDKESSTWTLNTNLFRYGVTKNLEFRLVTELVKTRVNSKDSSEIGVNNMQMGIKYRLVDKDVQVAILIHSIFNSGSSNLSNPLVGLCPKLLVDVPVTENFGFGFNLGMEYFDKEDYNLLYTLAFGFGLTEKIGYFAEIYGDGPKVDNLGLNFDNGFTYLIKNNLQLDFSVGTGISERQNFYSAGISWRRPE